MGAIPTPYGSAKRAETPAAQKPKVPRRIAPLRDYEGKAIYDGDRIVHPSGETGVVAHCKDAKSSTTGKITCGDTWRVLYDDGSVSRLQLQVGKKGRAVVDGDPPEGQRVHEDEGDEDEF